MQWKQGLDAYSANAETSFVKMRIFVDMPNTKGMDAIRYVAHVEALDGEALMSKDDIASILDAKAWCRTAYLSLLNEELRAITF